MGPLYPCYERRDEAFEVANLDFSLNRVHCLRNGRSLVERKKVCLMHVAIHGDCLELPERKKETT